MICAIQFISLLLKMRLDMGERERQVKRLHESIKNYQLSPKTKDNLEKARRQMESTIEKKYIKSVINKSYQFPKFQQSGQEDFEGQAEVVNLYETVDCQTGNLSVADEPGTNFPYVSQSTMLENQMKGVGVQQKIKIKLFKRAKNPVPNHQLSLNTEKIDKTLQKKPSIKKFKRIPMPSSLKKMMARKEKHHNFTINALQSYQAFEDEIPEQTTPNSHYISCTDNKPAKKYFLKGQVLQNRSINVQKSNQSSINLSIQKKLFKQSQPKHNKKHNHTFEEIDENEEQLKNNSVRIIRLGVSSREKRKRAQLL